MHQIVIAVTGKIGAGKSTVVNYLVEKHGASRYLISDHLRRIMKWFRVRPTRRMFTVFATSLRWLFGSDYLGRWTARQIQRDSSAVIVVDGIRNVATNHVLAIRCPYYCLIGITANDTIRYDRVRNRGEKAGEWQMSRAQFNANGRLTSESEVDILLQLADEKLENEGSLFALYEHIDALVAALRVKT